MAYKIERAKERILEIEIAGEIIPVTLGGVESYKRYLEAVDKFGQYQKKLEIMTEGGKEAPEELLQLLGDAVVIIFNIIFGEKTTDKLITFFENNYDEMLLQVLPWIQEEWSPAMRANAKSESRKRAGLETE